MQVRMAEIHTKILHTKIYKSINISLECGGAITRPNVTISPPSSDGGYQNRANCKWFIVAPPGFLVQLKFNSFDLEAYPECRYDYVQIYDNIILNETDVRSIGRYCGSEAPPIILSTSRALTILFKTDDTVTGEGFVATYDFIDGRNCKYFFDFQFSIYFFFFKFIFNIEIF